MSRHANRTPNEIQRLLVGGLIPATPVTFDQTGRLHESAHEAYVHYMSSQPIAGVAVWAHTGRGLMLDAQTARRVLNDWRSALPEKVIIAGVGANNCTANEGTTRAIKMAESAIQSGADAFLVYPPIWLRNHPLRDKLIVDHHGRLSQLGLPIILFYLYEAAGGVSYSKAVLDELLSLPNVIGIKVATLDSVMTYQDIARQLQIDHSDKLLITGEDRFFGYSLRLGARAALVGLGAVCCELQADLIKAHLENNAEHFLELSDAVDQLAEALFVAPMEGYIQRILFALAQLRVIPTDAVFDPWGTAPAAGEFERIGRIVNSLTACTT